MPDLLPLRAARRARRFEVWLVSCPVLALAACGGSGGGGGGSDLAAAFDQGVLDWDEGTAAVVTVRLVLEEPLAEELELRVRDSGSGSAQSGLDYVPFAPLELRFPAGTQDGTAEAFAIDLLEDRLFEARDETIVLRLEDPTGVHGSRTHRLVIHDRDRVQVGFVATQLDVAEGAAPRHAVQVRASSPTSSLPALALRVRLSDSGVGSARAGVDYRFAQVDMVIQPEHFQRVLTVPLEVVADGTPEGAEGLTLVLTPLTPGLEVSAPELAITLRDAPIGPGLLVRAGDLGFSSGAVLDLGAVVGDAVVLELTLENRGSAPLELRAPVVEGDTRDLGLRFRELAPALARAPGPVRAELPGETVELVLERLPTAIAPGAVCARDGVPHPADTELEVYRGAVDGEPDSALLWVSGPLVSVGWLRRGARAYTLDPASPRRLEGQPQVLRFTEDLRPSATPPQCSTPDPGDPVRLDLAQGAWPGASALGRSAPTLRLAIETDVELIPILGDAARAEAYVAGLVAATAAILRRDIGVDLELVYLGLYPGGDDPWITPDVGGTTTQLLDEFQSTWTSLGAPVQAELNHFLAGASLGGGSARLATYCAREGAFAVSTGISGRIDWSTFTGEPDFRNFDLFLFAHELGHNLGAQHTHDYCPPLDHCFSNCSGQFSCDMGTLMSYCYLCLGTQNVRLEYHSFVANELRTLAGFSCLPLRLLAPGESLGWNLELRPDVYPTRTDSERRATLELRTTASGPLPDLTLQLEGRVN